MTMLTPMVHQPNVATNVKGTIASQTIRNDLQWQWHPQRICAIVSQGTVILAGVNACSETSCQSWVRMHTASAVFLPWPLMISVMRSAGLPALLIGSPVNIADFLIGSPITWHCTTPDTASGQGGTKQKR